MRTWREVDPRDLLHPLDRTLWAAWGWLGGLAQAVPDNGARYAPCAGWREAIMSETPEAVGQHRPEEATDKFVGVKRHGLATIALTPIPGGEADAPVTHVEDPRLAMATRWVERPT